MTFRFSDGKVVETGDAYDEKVTGTKFYVTGDAWGHVVFHVAWREGRGLRQANVRVCAETILALADAIRCCPDHICEDGRTGAKGPGNPPMWIGHALWHLEHPTAVRPCLDGARIIDVDRVLPAPPEPPEPSLPVPAVPAEVASGEPWRGTIASHVDLTDDLVRELRETCMDGSPLAEDCDTVLDHDREYDEDVAEAADRVVAAINTRARQTRRRAAELADDQLADLERDPLVPMSLRWEAQVALGRGRSRKTIARRTSARRACLLYWNACVTQEDSTKEKEPR